VHPTVAAIVGPQLIWIQTQVGVKNTDQMDRADVGEELIQVKKSPGWAIFLRVGIS
jgi:hypothetical protein